ncbi:unnamed protein product, partial [Brassica oleracea var. botrytis]
KEDNVPIFKVDDHIGVTIAGLTADGRVFSRYMRSESVNHSFTYEPPLPVGRLVVKVHLVFSHVFFRVAKTQQGRGEFLHVGVLPMA